MKILLTGHRGFIGQHLLKMLSIDHLVIGIDLLDKKNILTSPLPDVDLVIHLAGMGGVRQSMENPKQYWDNNVIATQKILKHYKNQRVLFASSSTQYEPWLNPYAASKHIIEKIPHNNSVAMRFHTVYGATNRKGMFFDRLLMGTLEYVTDHSRDFVHIEDVCEAITILMDSTFTGSIDIGTGESVYVKDIAPNLPMKKGSILERQHSQADPTAMKKLGWKPKWTVQKFLDENGFEVKLQV
jgi:nucleoside-diphosphate-sugar epimerase